MQIQAGFLCAILNHILEIKDENTIRVWRSALQKIVKEPKKKRANISQSCVLELRPDPIPSDTLTKQYDELIEIFKDLGKPSSDANLVNKHRASLLRLKYSICHIKDDDKAGERLSAEEKAGIKRSKAESSGLSDRIKKQREQIALRQRATAKVQEISEILKDNDNRRTNNRLSNANMREEFLKLKAKVNAVLERIREDDDFKNNGDLMTLVRGVNVDDISIKDLKKFLGDIQAELLKISKSAPASA